MTSPPPFLPPSWHPARLAELSDREVLVLQGIAAGLTNDEISARLHLSTETVKSHMTSIRRKFGLCGQAARALLVALAFELGVATPTWVRRAQFTQVEPVGREFYPRETGSVRVENRRGRRWDQ